MEMSRLEDGSVEFAEPEGSKASSMKIWALVENLAAENVGDDELAGISSMCLKKLMKINLRAKSGSILY